jgi:alpha-mannosidase
MPAIPEPEILSPATNKTPDAATTPTIETESSPVNETEPLVPELPPLPESELIHVHLVCHSHDDVGWQSPPEGYYQQRVRDIITSVVQALKDRPDRRFSQTEIYYFERWWNEQNDTVKEDVKRLVAGGQLEFINGGWVSNDEACPSYEEIITNIMTGHAFL